MFDDLPIGSYLAKAGVRPPPPTPEIPVGSNVYKRQFPVARYYPSVPSHPPPHTFTFTYPRVRVFQQLPPFEFNPEGWVYFGVITSHPGPGMRYKICDGNGSGPSVSFRFVDSWNQEDPGEPSGVMADKLRKLPARTLLCIKCPTWSMEPGGRTNSL